MGCPATGSGVQQVQPGFHPQGWRCRTRARCADSGTVHAAATVIWHAPVLGRGRRPAALDRGRSDVSTLSSQFCPYHSRQTRPRRTTGSRLPFHQCDGAAYDYRRPHQSGRRAADTHRPARGGSDRSRHLSASVTMQADHTDSFFTDLPLNNDDQQALDALLDALETQHRQSIIGIIVYGSCLRSGDIFDGLVDLYLLCSSYRDAYGAGALAVGNRLLPPNVFYAQQQSAGRTLRSKVSVVSLADFQQACSTRHFESYFWGRFAQPVSLPRVRDDAARQAIATALSNASRTLLKRSLPVLPASGAIRDLWVDALQLSYATELRTERQGRARELVLASERFYMNAARRAAEEPSLRLALDFSTTPPTYRSAVSSQHRRV